MVSFLVRFGSRSWSRYLVHTSVDTGLLVAYQCHHRSIRMLDDFQASTQEKRFVVASRYKNYRSYSAKPGTQFVSLRSFRAEDVKAFCIITGDYNPIHDEEAMRAKLEMQNNEIDKQTNDENIVNNGMDKDRYHGAIVPGMFVASMFPSTIAAHFPGAVYLRQSLTFRTPVEIGQAVRATVTLEKISGSKAQFDTVCHLLNDNDDPESPKPIVIEGKALALLNHLEKHSRP